MQEGSAIQLQVKTILNRIQAFVGFVYQDVRLCAGQGNAEQIEITVVPHGGIRGRCSACRRPAPGYDRLPERRWLFVPLWGIPTWFRYAPRRVECAEHGVAVEYLPWSDGKRPVTYAMMGFLARWARRLSWRETAQAFQTSWEAVYRSVEWFVEWGLEHRQLDGVTSIGVDEIHWGHGMKADNFLTVVYQIDAGCRRLLWIGKRRSEKTLRQGLKALGPDVVKGLRFVCSDMWKPYLNVLAAEAGQALHVLAIIAQRKPGAWRSPKEAQRASRQQAGHRSGMGVEGSLPALLEVQVPDLGRSLPRLLVPPRHAQSPGTDAESCPHVAQP